MKLIYIANARIPTEKAHGVQIVRMCEAFANQGITVELVLPYRINSIHESISDYYGLKNQAFSVKVLPAIDLVSWGRVGFLIHYCSFVVSSFVYTLFSSSDIIFSREYLPLHFFSLLGRTTIYEMHDFPQSHLRLARAVCTRATKVVCTNTWSAEKAKNIFNLADEKVIVRQNGVRLEDFSIQKEKKLLREKYGIQKDVFVVLYAGHLYPWKGGDVLAEAATLLPDEYQVVFVGGHTEDRERLQKQFATPRSLFLGIKPHREIPELIHTADVAVLPNIPATQHSEFSTSPLKLFEYMASKVPIIASDLPSLRSIVSDEEVLFIPPGDVQALVMAIQDIHGNSTRAEERAIKAFERARTYTWESRARAILSATIS